MKRKSMIMSDLQGRWMKAAGFVPHAGYWFAWRFSLETATLSPFGHCSNSGCSLRVVRDRGMESAGTRARRTWMKPRMRVLRGHPLFPRSRPLASIAPASALEPPPCLAIHANYPNRRTPPLRLYQNIFPIYSLSFIDILSGNIIKLCYK